MSEKKELNVEELEKVTGGYSAVKDIKWLFSENEKAYVKLTDETKIEGKVTKKGFLGMPSYAEDCYCIESAENTNINGWYMGANFSNKTTSINTKLASNDVNIIAW